MPERKIGITQKVLRNARYGEMLDCLDQCWADLLLGLDLLPVPLPNIDAIQVPRQMAALDLDGVILSGGNTVGHAPLGNLDDPDIFPRRDAYEAALLVACRNAELPVLGVCRGMQHINILFGGGLARIKGHVGQHRHVVHPIGDADPTQIPDTVNTFHDWAIQPDLLAPGLVPLATDDAGNIEAFRHGSEAVHGVMWHPEREQQPLAQDVRKLRSLFG